jgi:preprotein translocase subunit SecF
MIHFSKYYIVYALLSLTVLLAGIFSLITSGLKPSIDFTGGTLIDVKFLPDIPQEKIEQEAKKQKIVFSTIQKTGNEYLLRAKDVESDKFTMLLVNIKKDSSVSAVINRQEIVGPVLGQELLVKALVASLLAIIVILLYVAYAFKNFVFGLSAVIALIHDLLVVIGLFSIFGKLWGVEVDTLFVTAVLTTMSFSVHDTIVVFDRIREYRRRSPKLSLNEVADRAMNETMGRSLANSITIILMLIALVLMGGDSVRWFAVALLIGTISGTYSSPFVATPIAVIISKMRKDN